MKSLVLISGLLPATLYASGTFLPEAGSPGGGLAGAGDVVNTRSAAVMWANPAAMAGLEREMISFNVMPFQINVNYKDQGSTGPTFSGSRGDGDNAGSWLPGGGFFWHLPLSELDERFSVGLAFSSVGGAALDYGTWRGDELLKNTSLLSVQFNPVISYRIDEHWSVGAGIQINQAWFEMETRQLELHRASDAEVGYTLGFFYQPNDLLTVGWSYRSEIDHEFEDQFESTLSGLGLLSLSGKYQLSMPFVAQSSLGLSYRLSPELKILASLGWQQWSSMDRIPVIVTWDGARDDDGVAIMRNWDDVWQFAVGVEYQLNPQWLLSTGLSYETPALEDDKLQRADLPVDRQVRFAFGAMTQLREWDINIFYQYADLGNPGISNTLPGGLTRSELKGEFVDYHVHYIGISASRNF